MDKEELRRGISAYEKEQKMLLRLIRKTGGLTASKFDTLFWSREYRRPTKIRPISGDSFLLGMGVNGFNEWAWHLELLQKMMALDLINTERRETGELVYVLPKEVKCSLGPRVERRTPPRLSTVGVSLNPKI